MKLINKEFTDEYKNTLFFLWYNTGKFGYQRFYNSIPTDENGNRPSLITVRGWINSWQSRADFMDEQVRREIEGRLVQEKIAMLERHSTLGIQMQDMALEYLDAHKDELTPGTSVRMLVEGVRIERESRGIPQALGKMIEQSDEELLKQIEDIISKAEVYEEPND